MPREIKISVVIPVFNVAGYLRQCLDSVIEQSLSDFEIITINDASTDTSGLLLDEYEAIDRRINVVHLASRGGAAAARNVGLEKASGTYLIFLDGDDFWTSSDMLQDLYDRCVAERLDVLEFRLHRSGNSADKPLITTGNFQVLNLNQHLHWNINYNLNTKLISRQLLQANQLRFDSNLMLGEDALLSVQLYTHADRLGIYDKAYYFYRVHEQSITSTDWNIDKLFCTVQWFDTAISGMQGSLSSDRVIYILRFVATERIDKLLNRLGPIALDLLSTEQLQAYVQLWSHCITAVDEVLAAANAIAPNSTRLQEPFLGSTLLEAIRRNDTESFRRFFLSDRYEQNKKHHPGSITLSQEQGLMIARTILDTQGETIRCNFGKGIFITLPRAAALQLAAKLQGNRQPHIKLQFRL